jgi:plasmid stability protein
MSGVMVQIRNVPTELHRRLKARAAIEGMSMSDYVLRELRKALERPTRQEILETLRARPPRQLKPSPAEVIRAERDSR